jgi:hypothetical protein
MELSAEAEAEAEPTSSVFSTSAIIAVLLVWCCEGCAFEFPN